jgi:hypothetical protein
MGMDRSVRGVFNSQARSNRDRMNGNHARGPAFLIDRFGRQVEVGQMVLLHQHQDLACTVVSSRPILDPRLPPGSVEVVLQVPPIRMIVVGGQPRPDLVIVGTAGVDASPPQESASDAPAPGELPTGDEQHGELDSGGDPPAGGAGPEGEGGGGIHE